MKKRAITLLEIMIVIFLIGLIGSVVGYNMKGSLDEGKAFKTRQASAQVRDILLLEWSKGERGLAEIVSKAAEILKHSGLVKNSKDLLEDGWGEPFVLTVKGNQDISVVSERYKQYERKKKGKVKEKSAEEKEEEDAEDS
ncbi:MAG: hypothetical protein WCP39_00050 [Chlamydiota bacterium]